MYMKMYKGNIKPDQCDKYLCILGKEEDFNEYITRQYEMELTAKNTEITELRNRLDISEKSKNKKTHMILKLEVAVKERDNQIESMCKEMKSERIKYREEIKQFEYDNKEDESKANAARWQQKSKALECTILQKEKIIKTMKKDNECLEQAHEKIKEDIEICSKSNSVLSAKIDEQKIEMQNLKQEIEIANGKRQEEYEKYKHEITNFKDDYTKQANKLKHEIKENENEIITSFKEIQHLRDELKLKTENLKSNEEILETLNYENKQLKGNIDSLQEKLSGQSNQSEFESLIKENEALKHKNDSLETEFEYTDRKQIQEIAKINDETLISLVNENKSLGMKIHSLEEKIRVQNHERNDEKSRYLAEKLQLEDIIDMLKKGLPCHSTVTLDQKIKEKDKVIEKLTNRLSQEMSKKVSLDEIALENINIKHRPMNIASEYEGICSSEWYYAKNALDKLYPCEDDNITLLRAVYELSEVEADETLDVPLKEIQNILADPVNYKLGTMVAGATCPTMPNKILLKTSLSDILRSNADVIDLSALVKKVCEKTNTYGVYHSTNKDFLKFVRAVVKLSWKMAVQKPVMYFAQRGIGQKWQGESKQRVFWKSSDPNNVLSRVKYYVQPALYHGDMLMVQGQVFLKEKYFV